MISQNIFIDILNVFLSYLIPIIISGLVVIFGYIFYIIIRRQISKLTKREKIAEETAGNVIKIIRYIIILIIATGILMQFTETLGLITALFTLVGGTILGFAAMNTIGNMIAGFIVMFSKPFSVGDRIYCEGKLADVIEIKLIYTVLQDLDHVKISVPNQKLLLTEIENYGKNEIIRRHVTVTPSFDEDRKKVEKTLIEAGKSVPFVLEEPEPYVWINSFKDYAVEYKVFVFIDNIAELPHIESNLHKAVLDACKNNNIDISTPLLLKQVQE
jgi:small-conductance mechanosensitive channel